MSESNERASLWTVMEGIGGAVVAFIALGGVIASYASNSTRLTQLESTSNAQTTEVAKQRDALTTLQANTDHRVTVVEEGIKGITASLSTISTTLQALDGKVDKLSSRDGR